MHAELGNTISGVVVARMIRSSAFALTPAAANAVDPQLRAVVGWATAVAGFVVYAMVQHVAFMRAMHRHYDPFVMAELAARGQAVCPACLHRLGPQPPVTCPECGSATLRGG